MNLVPEPPELPRQFIPVVGKYIERLRRWLRDHARVFEGDGIAITDTPGGGKTISVSSAAIAAFEIWGFQGYSSPYTGTGTAPSDQGLRVKVRIGTVNEEPPANNSAEFICGDDATTLFYIDATFDAQGVKTGSTIEKATSIPSDPAGSENNAPAHSYRGIFAVVTEGGGISEITPIRKGGLDVHPVVTNVGCGTVTVQMQWTGGGS